jgi:phosphatidylglycerophosphate synthase
VSEAGARSLPGRYRARDAFRIPGLLSLCRLPLALVFPFVHRSVALSVLLLAVAGLTDLLDGWYARRFHQETATGAVLDGIMDKAFVLTVLATLVGAGMLSLAELAVLSAREIGEGLLVLASLILKPRPIPTDRAANFLGKAATFLQFLAIVSVLVGSGARTLSVYAAGACGVLAVAVYAAREFSPAPKVA